MMKLSQPDLELHHGVFIKVDGSGVLLSGRSGIGKSELALGLINRNHQLIADDSVQFHLDKDKVIGKCPPILQNFLEVRGLGILNIKAMFGEPAIVAKSQLELIIHLKEVNQQQLYQFDRLHGEHSSKTILKQAIPEVCLPVAPGRNLSVLVECAVRNHVLKLTGYHAVEEFTKRHNEYMNQMRNN